MIEAQSCSVIRRDNWLLNNVSVQVPRGEITSVIGPNGAGKTTLLRVLSGDLSPDTGSVLLDGQRMAGVTLAERAGCIALLPQKSLLDFPFLVPEVIEMGRFPHGTSVSTDHNIVASLMERLDLNAFVGRDYHSLSGGEQQRVQVARVVAQLMDRLSGACLIFDEPTAPLDLKHQLGFFKLARHLAESGAAVIVAVHDINLAARFSDRIWLLKQGELMTSGEPQEVIRSDTIEAAFGVAVKVTDIAGGYPVVSFQD